MASNIDSAQILCKCIESWQNEVEKESGNISAFDWTAISMKMKAAGINSSEVECCRIWKYLAYGKLIDSDDILSIDSDEDECFFQPYSAVKRFVENTRSSSDNYDQLGPNKTRLAVKALEEKEKILLHKSILQGTCLTPMLVSSNATPVVTVGEQDNDRQQKHNVGLLASMNTDRKRKGAGKSITPTKAKVGRKSLASQPGSHAAKGSVPQVQGGVSATGRNVSTTGPTGDPNPPR